MKILLPLFVAFCTVNQPIASAQDAAKKAGTATLVVGEVTFSEKGEDARKPLKSGDVLGIGATVFTKKDCRAVILTSRQSAIRIGAESEVVLDEMRIAQAGEKAKVKVNLKKGSLGALIKSKELGAMDFSVKTPHGVAAARGTFYAVAVTEEKSYTQVAEGVVQVVANGGGEEDPTKDELGKAIPPATEEEKRKAAEQQ